MLVSNNGAKSSYKRKMKRNRTHSEFVDAKQIGFLFNSIQTMNGK